MRWIHISPHFDDAVLSCGGMIFEQAGQGLLVEIWTICAGTPPAGEISPLIQEMHLQWGTTTPEETVLLRMQEDREAAALVGAGTHHFGIPDCIYRRSPQGELIYTEGVFGHRHPLEADLDATIAAALENELCQDDILVCPLTIGGHVDHVLTRQAVERLENERFYYADIPYLLNHPEALAPATMHLQERTFAVSEAGLAAWQDSAAAHRSQIKILFETEAQMRLAIERYWAERRAIRLWY